MWTPTPTQPPFACAVCKAGADAGPFCQIGTTRVNLQGNVGPAGPVYAFVEVCASCMFVAVNHPESPYHGKIPAADELAEELAAEKRVVEAQAAALAGALEREQALQAEHKEPQFITRAAVSATVAELDRRGLLRKPAAHRPAEPENSPTPLRQPPPRPARPAGEAA